MSYYHLTPPPADPTKLCVTVEGKLYPVCWHNKWRQELAQERSLAECERAIRKHNTIPVIFRTGHYHGFRIKACHSDPKRYADILAASTPTKQPDASGTEEPQP